MDREIDCICELACRVCIPKLSTPELYGKRSKALAYGEHELTDIINAELLYNGMGQATRDIDTLLSIIDVAINSCKDITMLSRPCFAPGVDPVRWIKQLQAHLETTVTIDE